MLIRISLSEGFCEKVKPANIGRPYFIDCSKTYFFLKSKNCKTLLHKMQTSISQFQTFTASYSYISIFLASKACLTMKSFLGST